jgi:hypothetical protein
VLINAALIHTEIEAWNTMTEQNQQPTPEYLFTRRMALATLATLLMKVRQGPLTALVIHEFLSQAATGITTCWQLLNGDGIEIVEQALLHYFPLLVAFAKQSSPYQQTAAYLASQSILCVLCCLCQKGIELTSERH